MQNGYKLTYHDGSSENITSEELAELQDNVNYVSYKKSYSHDFNTVSVEVASSVSPHLGVKKTLAYTRQTADYEAKKGLEKLIKEKA